VTLIVPCFSQTSWAPNEPREVAEPTEEACVHVSWRSSRILALP
jgi:hypothetical protein